MATIAYSTDTDRGEARFFFTMACVMAVTIFAGFLHNLIVGRSNFGEPWVVHLHAAVMISWIALYLAQNYLVFSDNVALHRRLGWLAAILLPAVVAMGFVITRWSLQSKGGPPFFAENEFLFGDLFAACTVGGLVLWAVTVRRNTGWHRRLMFCAFAILTVPGLGRLIPNMLLIPYAWWAGVLAAALFPVIGMLADKRRYGRVHPAWFWGLGLFLGVQAIGTVAAYSAPGLQLTRWVIAGTPGAQRPMEAFVHGA